MRAITSLEIVIRPSGDESACPASTTVSTTAARSGLRGEQSDGTELDGFLDLAGFQTTRAHIGTGRLAVQEDPNALEVGVEAPLRGDHRMAPVVTETGL